MELTRWADALLSGLCYFFAGILFGIKRPWRVKR
jgi:hypothetical protein